MSEQMPRKAGNLREKRPQPPPVLLEDFQAAFIPAPELAEWAQKAFIAEDALLLNSDHEHLRSAAIGFLWTNVPNTRKMLPVAGQAELGTPSPSLSGKWARGRFEYQVRQWFRDEPDFIITIAAQYAATCDDTSFCALIEHELYHCAQRLDEFGAPKFRRDGRPVFGIIGHDVEEFVGIVRRYGTGAAAGRTVDLIEASKRIPAIGAAQIAGVCGTCHLKAA